jgi:hypothetical protein
LPEILISDAISIIGDFISISASMIFLEKLRHENSDVSHTVSLGLNWQREREIKLAGHAACQEG